EAAVPQRLAGRRAAARSAESVEIAVGTDVDHALDHCGRGNSGTASIANPKRLADQGSAGAATGAVSAEGGKTCWKTVPANIEDTVDDRWRPLVIDLGR